MSGPLGWWPFHATPGTGKGIVLDVKALDTQGRTSDVEVQVSS